LDKKEKNKIVSELAEQGIQTTIIGIVTSIVLAAIKAIAGVMGNSYALIADSIESASDVFTSIIVLTGLKIARRPADETHPYGHGKAEPFAGYWLLLLYLLLLLLSLLKAYTK
jgi:cation diffusion facilitator family transporter